MKWFKRISLFILVNLLVMLTISLTLNILTGIFGIRIPMGYQGLLFMCAIFGFSGAFITLILSKFIAKRFNGVQVIDAKTTDPELRDLVAMVENLARNAGLKVPPEVGVFDSPEINAFATGPSRNNSLIAVSTGLLRAMNRTEIEGVLGHETAHIANGDMVTMTLIQGVVNTFVMFLSRALASMIANGGDRDNRRGSFGLQFMLTMVFDICFGLLASILVNYFSRRREFRADAGGAKFAGRDKMLSGLLKLQTEFEQIAPDNSGTAVLKISNKSSGWMSMFSTHPPLEERIRRLQAPGK